MAINNDLENQKAAVKELNEEYQALNDAIVSIASNITEATKETEYFDNATKRVAVKYSRDLTNATANLAKNNRELATLQEKQLNKTKLTEADKNFNTRPKLIK